MSQSHQPSSNEASVTLQVPPLAISQKFTKKQKILRSHDFRLVGRHGTRQTGEWMVVELLRWRNAQRPAQIGITVSRKFGDAVHRNQFKRWVREAFRRHYPLFGRGQGFVIIPRSSARQANYQQIESELLRLLGHRPRGEASTKEG
ncbi:MAG: ribonuclease P protein component [Chlamydiia bacterium]